jgi:hypothetical protein
MTYALAVLPAVACGLQNPNDSAPAKRMREVLRPGMTLREVCTRVAPLAPHPGSCLVGQGCPGEWDVLAIETKDSGYTLARYRLRTMDEQTVPVADVERTLEGLRTCAVLKVGYGYYDVRLKLDGDGRLREIGPVLIENNPDAPLP